jgi:hypothetical protein
MLAFRSDRLKRSVAAIERKASMGNYLPPGRMSSAGNSGTRPVKAQR